LNKLAWGLGDFQQVSGIFQLAFGQLSVSVKQNACWGVSENVVLNLPELTVGDWGQGNCIKLANWRSHKSCKISQLPYLIERRNNTKLVTNILTIRCLPPTHGDFVWLTRGLGLQLVLVCGMIANNSFWRKTGHGLFYSYTSTCTWTLSASFTASTH